MSMANDSEPYIVTVNFGFEKNDEDKYIFYFHSANDGRKIDMLRKNPRVCLSCECSAELKNAQTACERSYAYECTVAAGTVHAAKELKEKSEMSGFAYKAPDRPGFLKFLQKKTQNVLVGRIVVE